jgi:hypothetical protein
LTLTLAVLTRQRMKERTLARQLIPVDLHRGRVFNIAGDAILEFGSAVEAVRCAAEIQAALRTRNDQLPAAPRSSSAPGSISAMSSFRALICLSRRACKRWRRPVASVSPAASTTRSKTSCRCRSNRSATSVPSRRQTVRGDFLLRHGGTFGRRGGPSARCIAPDRSG